MQPVDVPVYDFTTHQRSKTETRRVEPADVIVIEGILVLHIPEVCQRLNMKVYVDTDDDVRLARRCASDADQAPVAVRLESYPQHQPDIHVVCYSRCQSDRQCYPPRSVKSTAVIEG